LSLPREGVLDFLKDECHPNLKVGKSKSAALPTVPIVKGIHNELCEAAMQRTLAAALVLKGS